MADKLTLVESDSVSASSAGNPVPGSEDEANYFNKVIHTGLYKVFEDKLKVLSESLNSDKTSQ